MARSRLYPHHRSGDGHAHRPPPPDLLVEDGVRTDDDDEGEVEVASRIKSFRALNRNRPLRQFLGLVYVVGLTWLYGYGLLFGGREGDRIALNGLANEGPAGLTEEMREAAEKAAAAAADDDGPKKDRVETGGGDPPDPERKGTTREEEGGAVELKGDPLSYENVRYVNAVLERKQVIEVRIRRAHRAEERRVRWEREEERRREAEEAERRTVAEKEKEKDREGREREGEREAAAVEEKEEAEVEKRKDQDETDAGGADVVDGDEAEKEAVEDSEKDDDDTAEPGAPPLDPAALNKTKRPNLRGAGPFRGRTTNYRRHPATPSRFVPFLTIFTLCTLMRIFVNLLVASTVTDVDSDDEDDAGAAGGGGGPRGSRRSAGGGMRGLVRGGLLRNLRGGGGSGDSGPRRRTTAAGRERARARYRALVDRLNRQRAAHGERPISAESLRLVLSHRDFNGNDYDRLLQFNEENGPAVAGLFSSLGATDEEIGRCPRRVIEDENDDLIVSRRHEGGLTGDDGGVGGGGEEGSRRQQCAVCLEPYHVGDEVRTIPCFHTFHARCIDPWLSQKAECPVCKHPAIG